MSNSARGYAGASIQLLLNSPWQKRVNAIQQQLTRELSVCKDFTHISDVRTLSSTSAWNRP